MRFNVYGKPNCPFCDKAKALLELKGLEYAYIDVSTNAGAREMLVESGFRSVPQVYKADEHGEDIEHIGGYDTLSKMLG